MRGLLLTIVFAALLVPTGACTSTHITLQTWPGNSRVQREVCAEEVGNPNEWKEIRPGIYLGGQQCKRWETISQQILVGYSGPHLFKCKVSEDFYTHYAEGGAYSIPRKQCWEVLP